jgi:TATA element modulatory factor
VATLQGASQSSRKQIESLTQSGQRERERAGSLQEALDRAWADLKALQAQREALASSAVQSDAQRAAHDSEFQAAQQRLDASTARESALQRQLAEARSALSRAREKEAWHETQMQQEIAQLRERCAAEEKRFESVRAAVPDSTRPLLRQIEVLGANLAEREGVWEATERALQNDLDGLRAKLKAQAAAAFETGAQLSSLAEEKAALEADCAQLRATCARQASGLVEARAQANSAEERAASAVVRAEDAEAGMEAAVADSDGQSAELARARETAAAHGRRVGELQDQVRALQAAASSSSSSSSLPKRAHPGSNNKAGIRRPPSTDALVSVVGALPGGRLQELVRQKDSELDGLQQQLQGAQRRCDSLQDDLVSQGSRSEELALRVRELEGMQQELNELQRRHGAALEIIGEREETIEELRADIADMKDLYKSQISDLVEQLATKG